MSDVTVNAGNQMSDVTVNAGNQMSDVQVPHYWLLAGPVRESVDINYLTGQTRVTYHISREKVPANICKKCCNEK